MTNSFWNKHIDPSIPEADLLKFSLTENWFTYQDFYEAAASDPAFKIFVEVGVWKGHSLCHLVKKLQERATPFTVFAVDLWDKLPKENELWHSHQEQMPILYSIYNYVLSKTGTRKDVFDYRMNSLDAARDFRDGSVDFCFLDASHDKEAVLQDLDAWYPKVRKGGIIAGHDISSRGVFEAVREFNFGCGVMENVEQDTWAVWKN